jgi:uncharacterized membrane protein
MWTDWEHFPRFMSNVEQVTRSGDMTHWKAKIFGTTQEWDARIVETTPNQRVAWQSTTGSTNNGVVAFIPADGTTEVLLAIDYDPPAGLVGDAVDAVTNTMDKNVEEDLQNFKQLVEQGVSQAQVQGDTGAQSASS